jgi:transglutaminase-like putative cysteine protease
MDGRMAALREIGRGGHPFKIEIQPLSATHSLPLPAETAQLNPFDYGTLLPDGTADVPTQRGDSVEITGLEATRAPVRAAALGAAATDSRGASLPEGGLTALADDVIIRLTDTEKITKEVREFAAKAAPPVDGTGRPISDFDRATQLCQAVGRQCKYNLRAPAVGGSGTDPINEFLFTTQEGYCDLFASAMVAGARTLNLPARYVVGYLPEAQNTDSQGNTVIREADYHAWC